MIRLTATSRISPPGASVATTGTTPIFARPTRTRPGAARRPPATCSRSRPMPDRRFHRVALDEAAFRQLCAGRVVRCEVSVRLGLDPLGNPVERTEHVELILSDIGLV